MSWITLSSRIKPAHSRVKLNASVKKRKRRPPAAREEKPSGGRGKYLLGVLVLAAAGAGTWWGLSRAPYFSVRKIQVIHNHDYSSEEIIRIAGIKKGENIFRMNLAGSRRRLLKEINIQDAAFQRIFPATIRIKAIEREPSARVKYGRYYTIDQDGVILEGRKTRRGRKLPVIEGIKIKEGGLSPPAAGKACLTLLRELNRRGIEKYLNIKHIDLSSPRVVVMRTRGEMEIKLNAADLSRELQRLANLAPRISGRARSVDLRYANVPVVFKDR
jgi:cell division septal protein FtsQ